MTDAELNEAVALKLGWECVIGPPPMNQKLWVREGFYGPGQYQPPDYVTDIKVAWEIVDVLAVKGDVELSVTARDNEKIARCIVYLDGEHEAKLADTVAPTAPRAICEAFLKLP